MGWGPGYWGVICRWSEKSEEMREVALPTTPRQRFFATVSQSQMEEGADVKKDAENAALIWPPPGSLVLTGVCPPISVLSWCWSSPRRRKLQRRDREAAQSLFRLKTSGKMALVTFCNECGKTAWDTQPGVWAAS